MQDVEGARAALVAEPEDLVAAPFEGCRGALDLQLESAAREARGHAPDERDPERRPRHDP